jgi:hypothetical protein
MIPQREIELGAANYCKNMIATPARPSRAGRRCCSAKSVQDVRRFTAAGERARGAQVTPVPGQPRVSSQITYFDDLAQAADKVATKRREGQLFWLRSRLAQAALNS